MWSNVVIEGKDQPIGRCKHAIALANNDLYLYGGKSNRTTLKDFWKLELRAGKWIEIKSETLPNGNSNSLNNNHAGYIKCSLNNRNNNENASPPCLQEHSMVYYEGNLYMFGGEIGLDHVGTPLWIYSTHKNHWRKWEGVKRVQVPVGRRGHIAAIHSNYMLIYGGYQDLRGSLGDLWAFHFETESWHLFYTHQALISGWFSPPVPSARHSHAGLTQGGSLFVYGGMTDLEEKSDFWRFDIGTRRWTQLKKKPNPGALKSHSMTKALNSLFLYGGERDGRALDEFWKYSLESETWEKVCFHGTRPGVRSFPAVIMLPAIIKMRSQSVQDPLLNYWWDYTEFRPKGPSIANPPRRRSSGSSGTNYRFLNSHVPEECGVQGELEDESESSSSPDEFPPKRFPIRSESANCIRVSSGVGRVKKSSSVKFATDLKQIPHSTSDYASMETIIERPGRPFGFENPNYKLPATETIEMESLSPDSPDSTSRFEVTTPNYFLVVGGLEPTGATSLKPKPVSIWRLRISPELFL